MQWLHRLRKNTPRQTIAPGTCIKERYHVEHCISQSAIATIWQVTDTVFNRKLAIKVIDLGDAKTDTIQDAFLLEMRTIAMMEHPHIVPIQDAGSLPNGPFIAMPLAAGGDLAGRIREEGMLPQEVVSIGQTIAVALDYAHREQVLHLNLKPSNILFDDSNYPYLTDFGMHLVRQDTPASDTALYQAPEMVTGEPVDSRADDYMFGIVLYQMLTGQVPFSHITSGQAGLARAQLANPDVVIPSVQTFRDDLPTALDIVFQRLTHCLPEKRYSNAYEAVITLTETLSKHGKLPVRVFVSYSRQDKTYVYKLAEKLEQAGIDLWIDQQITMGRHWDTSIESALNDCNMMLVVLSKAAAASENVADEWSYFLEQGKTVLPLIHETCDVPFRLRRRQHIMSTGNILEDVALIVKELHKTVAR